MSKIAAIAWLSAKKGRRDELIEIMKKVWRQAESEAGTEVYTMNTADSDSLFYYVVFSDQQAFDKHITGPAMQEAMRDIDDLLDFGPEWIQATPVWAKGGSI